MRIDVFIDGNAQPIETLTPPDTFELDTESLADGPHELTFKATDSSGEISVRKIAFQVRNGPAIAVHGVVDGDTLHGKVGVLANAYGARVGDQFEPQRMETPAPVPTWAWVLFLGIFAWGAGYISLELSNHVEGVMPAEFIAASKPPLPTGSETAPRGNENSVETGATDEQEPSAWVELGAQVYGINCSSCHQANGVGLPNVFPPLAGNASVLDADPSAHITTVLHGLSSKVIDGVAYTSPMPAFGSLLSDEQVAAAINHERTQWGNDAPTVTPRDVAKLR